MSSQKYQLSQNLQIVSHEVSETSMIYHTLFGNPRLINRDGIRFMDLFKHPITLSEACQSCEGNPEQIIHDFTEIFFLVEHGIDERNLLAKQKTRHLAKMCWTRYRPYGSGYQ